MAEDAVKRVTGLNSLLPVVPDMGMPFVGKSTSTNTCVDASLPIQRDANHFFHSPVPNNVIAPPHEQRMNNSFPPNRPAESLMNAAAGPNNISQTSSVRSDVARGGSLP